MNEFRGTPQLSTGKYGKIEVLEKGKGGGKKAAPIEDEEEEDSGMEEEM